MARAVIKHLISKAAVLIFLIAISAARTRAQQTPASLQRKVNITVTNIRFDSLLSLVSKHTGVKFAVNTHKFPPSKIIRVRKGVQPITTLLDNIREHTGIWYTVVGSHVIFVDNPPRKKEPVTAPATTTAAKYPAIPVKRIADTVFRIALQPLATVQYRPDTIPDSSGLAFPSFGIKLKKTRKVTADTSATGWLNISLLRLPSLFSLGLYRNDTMYRQLSAHRSLVIAGWYDTTKQQPPPPSPATAAKNTAARIVAARQHTERKPTLLQRTGDFIKEALTVPYRPSTNDTRSENSDAATFALAPFIRTGVYADETFYVNPTLHLGLPFLYGVLTWSSNLNKSLVRYGAGTSVRLADNWRMHLQVTTGSLNLNATDHDTLGTALPLETKSNYLKAALLADKRVGKQFRLLAGVTFNQLSSTYYFRNNPVAPGDRDYPRFANLQPPGPPYGNNNENNKRQWIGFYLGIFYQLDFLK
ncbi:hypothetical protein [Chitinophaga solisilvae]|uniref:hypothetical protein n=1 Tax=Chitinophaga solisilvae TaxID=1233460 RepID=UPI00136818BC|nr:hypothetical protein [Chitinophaga solisilvae]